MCQDNTSMYVCDYQRLHTAIIRGVFGAREWESNVDKPRFHKGLAVAGKCVRNMDTHSAGFVDWVAKYGTQLDVAAVAMAIPGQTMRGWLSTWTGSFGGLYEKFLKVREDFRPFIHMPGSWCWIEDDFFVNMQRDESVLNQHFDVLAIDPPRLGSGPKGKDAYSLGAWPRLNATLGGDVKIKPWTTSNFFSLLHQLLSGIQSEYILFTWTEGNPSTDEVRSAVWSYGMVQDEQEWESYSKVIYGWRIRRA